ncbi:MAG TPA: hypothetical protein VJZ00_16010, partial [Thermoanaerobaculia bacterium]|nr:hypothetical protein [Thermoanaerobaculia bacterium]
MRRVLLLLILATPAFAKSLHWKSVDVDARLEADGSLRVIERQRIVFDGDWNGGERDFNLRPQQTLDVNSITRGDVPLTRGDLAELDHWDFASRSVVRWRSRMPADPPFENTEIPYTLDVTYHEVLLAKHGGTYVFQHDFGLPKRDDVIERFTLHLTFDPIWSLESPVTITETNVPPRRKAIVTRELTFSGAHPPTDVRKPVPISGPIEAMLLFAIGAALLIRHFIKDERAWGRFAPVTATLDDAVVKMRAEVAGAIWDGDVGAPEVAAVLARMTQEGKLSTRAERKTLYMQLLVDRATLTGYERNLVDALFDTGVSVTDTDLVRERYASSGFDPASIIRAGVTEEMLALHRSESVTRFRGGRDALLILGAGALLAASAFLGQSDKIAAIVGAFLTTFFALFACAAAMESAKAITNFGRAFTLPAILMFIACGPLIGAALLTMRAALHAPVLIALALWTLAWMKLVLDTLRIRDTADAIAFRKRVAGARAFFIEQLGVPQPALRDEWFPYVLAFGLGTNVDRWFRAHGGESSSLSSSSSSWSSASSSSSSGSS